MGETTTSRALRECRKRGAIACVVEQTVRTKGRTFKRDAYGFGDLLVVEPGEGGALLVQVTASGDMSRRFKKIANQLDMDEKGNLVPGTENPRRPLARAWLEAGNRIEVWGFAKRGKAGKRKLWTLRTVKVQLNDLEATA